MLVCFTYLVVKCSVTCNPLFTVTRDSLFCVYSIHYVIGIECRISFKVQMLCLLESVPSPCQKDSVSLSRPQGSSGSIYLKRSVSWLSISRRVSFLRSLDVSGWTPPRRMTRRVLRLFWLVSTLFVVGFSNLFWVL